MPAVRANASRSTLVGSPPAKLTNMITPDRDCVLINKTCWKDAALDAVGWYYLYIWDHVITIFMLVKDLKNLK